jgi:hypothetical protein
VRQFPPKYRNVMCPEAEPWSWISTAQLLLVGVRVFDCQSAVYVPLPAPPLHALDHVNGTA